MKVGSGFSSEGDLQWRVSDAHSSRLKFGPASTATRISSDVKALATTPRRLGHGQARQARAAPNRSTMPASRVLTRPLRGGSYSGHMQSRSELRRIQRDQISPMIVTEQAVDPPTGGFPTLVMCQTCGGETQRFASGWRSVLSEGQADPIAVIVVCPVCRTSAGSMGRRRGRHA